MTATRFWWVRHGPVPGPKTLKGRLDVPCDLSDAARLAALGRVLPAGGVIVASPLRRAIDTARAVTGRVPDVVRDDLTEQDFGTWSDKTWTEIADDAKAIGFWDDPAGTAPPGGESFAAQTRRVAGAIAALSAAHPDRDVACFCHAGTIRAALAVALGLVKTPTPVLGFVIDPLSCTRIDALQGGFRILSVNEGKAIT